MNATPFPEFSVKLMTDFAITVPHGTIHPLQRGQINVLTCAKTKF